jgi:hypothetical protein
MLVTPSLDRRCIPDGPGREPSKWLGEVTPLAVSEGGPLRDTKDLRRLGETGETESLHCTQAYEPDRRRAGRLAVISMT